MPHRRRLTDMVEQLDQLHQHTWLDVRHRDLFQKHALYLWPRLSDEIHKLLARTAGLAAALCPGLL